MLGLTQQALAEQVGCNHQTINKYETGSVTLLVPRLFALAQALGVDMNYFFTGLNETLPAEVRETRSAA